MTSAPILFISHGAPTLALEPGMLGPHLQAVGSRLRDLKAVLVVSPHWQTHGLRVMTTAAPPTLHDFGGFPAALYALRYPAPGSPELGRAALHLLSAAGFAAEADATRGLDHGAWVPLLHLLPQADVPVFQVSMPTTLTATEALRLGQALAPLRDQGVLIVGSGSLTHNLYDLRAVDADGEAYAAEFAAWVRQAVRADDVDRLLAYRAAAPHAARAHPSEEHFLPLLVALGANVAAAPVQVVEGGIAYGVLSMESYLWGMTDRSARSDFANQYAVRPL